jgi:DNA-binding phage protein
MKSNAMQNLAKILKEEKKRRGLTTEAFAVVLGISRSQLHEYMKGRGNPGVNTIELIAHKLGMTPSALLSDTSTRWISSERRIISMIKDFFTIAEVADEIGVDVGTAQDLLDDKGVWQTSDINKLLDKFAKAAGFKKLNNTPETPA